VASENEIAFENACVVTPTNATLVKDLNLRVPAGTNLLVTGPNGSGMGHATVCQIFSCSHYHSNSPATFQQLCQCTPQRDNLINVAALVPCNEFTGCLIVPLTQASRACSGCWVACGRWRGAAYSSPVAGAMAMGSPMIFSMCHSGHMSTQAPCRSSSFTPHR